jgi:hypothetical protein
MITSDLALQSYINEIKEYLTKKNITDFTKFEVSLHKDKLKYIKWDYPNIDKPTNIITKSIPIKPKFPQTFYYGVDIGSSKSPFKYTTYEYTYPFEILGKIIHAQVSLNQSPISTYQGHDDIFCNIRSIGAKDNNTIRIEIDTFRIKQEAWTNELRVFLMIVFLEQTVKTTTTFYTFSS